MQDGKPPTILYVDCQPRIERERRRLEGMRRYAAGRGWRVETLDHTDCTPAALKEALERLRPVGCVAECGNRRTVCPPRAFGDVPVVFFSPPEGPEWRGALRVECDEAAVARLAFKELSANGPPAYAVVSFHAEKRWQRERIDAFRECCREAGFDCTVASFPDNSAPRHTVPTRSLVEWAASLPLHCAVFAVNDGSAFIVADALARAGRSLPRTVTLVGADGQGAFRPEDMEIAPMVSSVVLDHEMAGYLAAKAIAACAANDDRRCAANDVRRCAANDGRRCAANELPATRASSLRAEPAPSLRAEPAPSLRAEPAPSLVFPPLLVARRQSTRGHGRREPRILEAMDMIRREACDGLTAAEIAARFPGTRQLFQLRFREAMGHPPLDEILNVRLERAMELLVHTDRSIASVAALSGFRTGGDFWHFFRKRTGLSPLRFRKERR
jgi:AraC-like DNA-binding protein